MVSNLLDNLNIVLVPYFDAEDDGDYCCKCPCMTNDTVSIVDSGVIESWCNRKGKNFLSYILNVDKNIFIKCVWQII